MSAWRADEIKEQKFKPEEKDLSAAGMMFERFLDSMRLPSLQLETVEWHLFLI